MMKLEISYFKFVQFHSKLLRSCSRRLSYSLMTFLLSLVFSAGLTGVLSARLNYFSSTGAGAWYRGLRGIVYYRC
jgi:hypothetical protein